MPLLHIIPHQEKRPYSKWKTKLSLPEVRSAIRYRPVGKESGKTSYIERFNCMLRQRCSRLVRKTLSFSKKLLNRVGMIMYFVCDYNLHLRALVDAYGSFSPACLELSENRKQEQSYDVYNFDHWVDGRACCVFVGIANCVASNGGLVGV